MKKLFKKVLVYLSVIAILVQSLSPVAYLQLNSGAYAQTVDETTASPTPELSSADATVDQTTPPADTQTPTPTPDTIIPAPTDTPTPSDTVSETPTPTPTDAVTPEPTPVDNLSPPVDNSQTSTDTSAQVQGESITPTPASEQPQENPKDEQLNIIVLDNVSAPSIDLGVVESQGSAALLTTDKPDYAPTDTALITGSNLLPNTTYILRVWSEDEPATSTEASVTSDENGVFAYAYQLDGTYRPNYSAELKDSAGNVVATVTFTDSPLCNSDAQGVNDQPNQKDLTRMCADYAGTPNTIAITWNWDEINGSGGNTFDACSLYDTDNDGKANYSACVTVTGIPLVQAANSPRIYSCDDANSDKCSGDTLIAGSYVTTCSTAQQNTDPFPAGDANPNDTVATCTIKLSEVGGSASKLLDVCSYPSQQPNSSPSDCIIASTASQTGTVELKKVWSGTPGQTTLNIGSTTSGTEIASVQTGADGGTPLTTGTKIVSTGTFYVSETGGLTDYTSSLSCTKNGQAYTPGANNSLVVGNNDIFICTFTNTRVNNGSINIVKVGENNNSQDFGFNTTGGLTLDETSSPDFSLDDDGDNGNTLSNTKTFTGVAAGTYTVSEIATAGWTLGSIVCVDPTQNSQGALPTAPTATINLAAGETVTCTFTNTLNKGNIKVNKMVDTNGDGDYADTGEGLNGTASNAFTWTYRGIGPNVMGTTQSGLTSGSGSLSENTVTNYNLVGWYRNSGQGSCANPDSTTLPASIDILTDQTVEITICNAINTGTVVVHKDVQGPNGEDVTDNSNSFEASLDGGTGQLISDNISHTYLDVPVGSHTITESLVDTDYTLYGISSVAGGSGNTSGLTITVTTGTNNVYVTNRQKTGTITVVKDVVDPSGGPISDTHSFTVNLTPGSQTSPLAEGSNAIFTVNPGTYTASESADAAYTSLGCLTPTGKDDIVVVSGGQATITCTNRQNSGTVVIHKDVQGPNGEDVTDAANFQVSLDSGTGQAITDNLTVTYNNVLVGNHTITESFINSGYTLYGISQTQGQSGNTGGLTINVTTGTNHVYVTNRQQSATITLIKDVLNSNGGAVSDSHAFTVSLNPGGQSDSFAEGDNAVFTVNPGTYTASENDDANYDELGCLTATGKTDIVVGSGGSATITCTNKQNPGTISGTKFDENENVLSGWTINLFSCTALGINCTTFLTSTVTTGSGYSFSNLVAGFYRVIEVMQAGWTNVSSLFHDFTINPGSTITQQDFVNKGALSITACKFEDSNGTLQGGIFTAVNNWTFTLGSTVQETGADNNCTTFTDLKPGTYTVTELLLPSGWFIADDSQGSRQVVLTDENENVNFYNYQKGSITGTKWSDADGDSEFGDEEVLPNWTIFIDEDENEELGSGETYTLTDQDGNYVLSNLDPEVYIVCEVVENGWVQTYPVNQTDSVCHEVTVTSGNESSDNDFGNQGQGTIIVEKDVVPNSDATFNFTIEGDLIEPIGFVLGDEDSNNYSSLPADTYTIAEESNELYTTTVDCVSSIDDVETASAVELDPGEIVTCTFTNTRNRGNILVHKLIDLDGNLETDDDQIDGEDWEIIVEGNSEDTSNPEPQNTDENGETTFDDLKTGEYTVSETLQDGFDLLDAYCDQGENGSADGETIYGVDVANDSTVECTFINSPNSTLHGRKWNDENGNGFRDGTESLLSGWTINLYKWEGEDEDYTDFIDSFVTDDDEHFGWYWFEHLLPGNYKICEEFQPGWNQTYPSEDDCHYVTLPVDSSGELFLDEQLLNATYGFPYDFGNEKQNPILTIAKTNDAVGDKSPGDTVGFTITISANEEGGPADNVTVTDLLSSGFVFNPSSWKVVSSDTTRGVSGDITSLLTAPTYASPGTWSLGHMNSGETLTLTYTATIDGSQ